MLENIPPEIVERQKRSTPVQRRLGTVKEVAEVVAWLASPASSWITGRVFECEWCMGHVLRYGLGSGPYLVAI